MKQSHNKFHSLFLALPSPCHRNHFHPSIQDRQTDKLKDTIDNEQLIINQHVWRRRTAIINAAYSSNSIGGLSGTQHQQTMASTNSIDQ